MLGAKKLYLTYTFLGDSTSGNSDNTLRSSSEFSGFVLLYVLQNNFECNLVLAKD